MPPSPKPKRRSKKAPPAKSKPEPSQSGRLSDYPPRLQGETPAAYAALCLYLDADPANRSQRRVFTSPARRQQASLWSSRYHWPDRAAAFDAAQRQARLDARLQREIERDLATSEHDDRVAALAADLLFSGRVPDALATEPQPLLYELVRIARNGHVEFARIEAVKTLVDLAGISDRRKAKLKQSSAPTITPASDVSADVVAALAEHATTEQLVDLCGVALVDDPPAPEPDPERGNG